MRASKKIRTDTLGRLLWAGALALSACSTASPSRNVLPAMPVPEAWSHASPPLAAAATADPARWWLHFGDPLLSALVDDALASNATLERARASLQQARAMREIGAAALAPGIDASASTQRRRSGSASTTNQFGLGLDASWEVDLFGGRRAALAAREAEVDSSQAGVEDAQVSVVAEVALAYVDLRRAQQRMDIATRNLDAQRETLQIARWRAQAGLATSLDVEQANAATRQTQAQLPAYSKAIAQARHSLALLTGRAPGKLEGMLGSTAPVPSPSADAVMGIPAETLRRRPDVRAAEAAIRAAAARMSEAEAARLPSLRLGGSIGLSALTLGGLTAGQAVSAALLANVSLPVLDGGAARGQLHAQEAALAGAQAAYRGTVLVALKEVEDALVALRADRARLADLQAAAESSDLAALLARQRYASGLVDFQTVLETQRSLLGAQDSVASIAADVAADHVRVFKAIGGGWPADSAGRSSPAPRP